MYKTKKTENRVVISMILGYDRYNAIFVEKSMKWQKYCLIEMGGMKRGGGKLE